MRRVPTLLRHLPPALLLLLAAAAVVAGVQRVSELWLVVGLLLGAVLALIWPGPARPSWRSRTVRALVAVLVLGLGLGAPLWSARARTSAGASVELTDTDLRFALRGSLGVPVAVPVGDGLGYLATSDRIHLVDTERSTERWSTDPGGTILVAAGGDLVRTDSSGTISRTSVDGSPLWDRLFTADGEDPRPVAADEQVVVVQSCGETGDDWATCRYEGVDRAGETVWTENGRELRSVVDGAFGGFVGPGATLDGRLPEVVATRAPEPGSEELLLRSPADGTLRQRIPRDREAVTGDDPDRDETTPALVDDLLLRAERMGGDCTLTAHQGDGVAWTAPVHCYDYGPTVEPDAPHLSRSNAGDEGGSFLTGHRLWLYQDGDNRDADTIDLRTGESRDAGPVRGPTDEEPDAEQLLPGADLLLEVDGRRVSATTAADGTRRWQLDVPGERVVQAWVTRDVVVLQSSPAPDQLFVPDTRSELLSVHDAETGELRARLPVDPELERLTLPLWDGVLLADDSTEDDTTEDDTTEEDILTARLLR